MGTRPRHWSKVLIALGLVLLLGAGSAIAYPLWWMHRSQTTGGRLLHEQLRHETMASVCHPVLPNPMQKGGRLAGILDVASLGLRAPVLQGLNDPVLNVAVGHAPSSPWPGHPGESILEAHDVSYFAGINALKPGNLVVWHDGCTAMTFKVISHEVAVPGAFIHVPPNGRGLALVTCYPTNALFWTAYRYIVLTEYVGRTSTVHTPRAPQVLTHLVVPAPPALVAQGLRLQDNSILLGTMSIAGTPSATFREGPAPLDVEADALEAFFGAQKSIAENQVAWWHDLAVPGLAMPQPWSDATPYFVTIYAVGNRVESVKLASQNTTLDLVVRHGELLISSVIENP
jgi:sortase A